MVSALACFMRDRGLILRCFHLDHGIRPREERLGDAEAVKALCRCLGLPVTIGTAQPGLIQGIAKSQGIGLEAAARQVRHRAWNREALRWGAARVLVAHTWDDLLETALMRVLRGSGPGGLASMPPSRGLILRPLLGMDRSQVLEYLQSQGLSYRTDSTNADPSYLRNRIRHKLIPLLDTWFPFWKHSLAHLAETQRYTAEFLQGEAKRRLPWEYAAPEGVSSWDAGERTGALAISRDVFFNQPEILREEALFLAAGRLLGGRRNAPSRRGTPDGPGGNRASSIRRISIRLFSQGRGPVDMGSLRAGLRGGRVILTPRPRAEEAGFSLLIKAPGRYKIKGIRIAVRAACQGSGASPGCFFAALPLAFRSARRDDRIVSWGGSGSFSRKKALDRSRRFGCADSITAEDSHGVAAFIGISRNGAVLLAQRTEKEAGQGFYCCILGDTGGLHGAE
jgi:tRNA(Ile)-lysidine synthase